MNIEKLFNSRINRIADWIIRLIMINIFVIFTSLLVVTILPSLSAGYNMFNDYINQRDTKLFKGYFTYFKENLGRKIVLSIIMSIVFGLGVSNIMFYNQSLELSGELFHNVGYFVTLSLLVMFYAVCLYSVVVLRVNSKMRFVSLFKLSFFLAGKNYLKSLLLIVVSSIPLVLFFFPQLFIVIIMFGISVPLLIHGYLTHGVVYYLENLGEKDD